MIDYSKFVENSRKWLSQYIKDNYLQSCVVGCSGGIDSTVSCAIASPVCKELNISLIGRSLPTSTNKSEEIEVANLVGNAFCTDFKEVPINCEDIIHEFELCEGKMTALQKGNIKARYRMTYLYNLASIHKGVVIDNDNFTEWNLGFFTLNGDVGDINLGLRYLWKTDIYELAEFLAKECLDIYSLDKCNENWDKYQAIKKSIDLIPTDGNGVSNSDCEQFGLNNYQQVDDVLKTMYYSNRKSSHSYKELQEFTDEYLRLIDSYNEQGVNKVMALYQNTAYKRKELPIKPTKEELGL